MAETDPDDPAFETWLEQASASAGVLGTSIRPGTPRGMTVVDLVPSGTSQGAQATSLVEGLRDDRPAFDIEVGGPAAELIDVKDRLSSRLPYAVGLVCLATLVLLFLMTGSLIVPVKAVIMNILSLGASFGAHRMDLPGRPPVRPARLRLGRCVGPVDARADPDLRLRALDGLRGVPALPDQGGPRPDRRQRPGGRRRPPTIGQDHHVSGGADRRGLRRFRRRGGTRHQAARCRAGHRRHRRCHARAHAARTRDHEAPRGKELVGAGAPAPVPRPIRTARCTLDAGAAAGPGRGPGTWCPWPQPGWRSPDERACGLRHRSGRQPPRRPAGRWRSAR